MVKGKGATQKNQFKYQMQWALGYTNIEEDEDGEEYVYETALDQVSTDEQRHRDLAGDYRGIDPTKSDREFWNNDERAGNQHIKRIKAAMEMSRHSVDILFRSMRIKKGLSSTEAADIFVTLVQLHINDAIHFIMGEPIPMFVGFSEDWGYNTQNYLRYVASMILTNKGMHVTVQDVFVYDKSLTYYTAIQRGFSTTEFRRSGPKGSSSRGSIVSHAGHTLYTPQVVWATERQTTPRHPGKLSKIFADFVKATKTA